MCSSIRKWLSKWKTIGIVLIFTVIIAVVVFSTYWNEFQSFLREIFACVISFLFIEYPLNYDCCISTNLSTTLSSIVTGFFALLGLLAAMHVFYLQKLHEDKEFIDKCYRELYSLLYKDTRIIIDKKRAEYLEKQLKKYKHDIINIIKDVSKKRSIDPNELKSDLICEIFDKIKEDKKTENLHLILGYRTLPDKVKFVKLDETGEWWSIRFNTLVAAFLIVIIWGIGLFLTLNKTIWLFWLAAYLIGVLISLFMFLKYLIKISVSSHT